MANYDGPKQLGVSTQRVSVTGLQNSEGHLHLTLELGYRYTFGGARQRLW